MFHLAASQDILILQIKPSRHHHSNNFHLLAFYAYISVCNLHNNLEISVWRIFGAMPHYCRLYSNQIWFGLVTGVFLRSLQVALIVWANVSP